MKIIYVYRDRLLPLSENFVIRPYQAFKKYSPVYIGAHINDSFKKKELPYRLIQNNVFTRAFYKQFGWCFHKKKFLADKPTLIHAHFGRGGAIALPLAKKLNTPLLVTFHGGDATKNKHYKKRLFPTIYQRRMQEMIDYASLIMPVSDFIKNKLIERGFPEHKLFTHYLGIELDKENNAEFYYNKKRSKKLLFIGRMVEKKGVDVLIKALSLAQESIGDISITLIGDGNLLDEMKKLATEKIKNYQFLGWQNSDEINNALKTHDYLCVSSQVAKSGDSEGLPTVIMESFRYGVPAIATKHAGIPEIVTDQKTGFLSKERDAKEFAANIIAAYKLSDQDYNKMQKECYDKVYNDFNAEKQSQKLEKIFAGITND